MAIGNTTKFAIVFVVVNLHTLSELSLALYLALYVPTVAIVALQYAFGSQDQRPQVSSRLFNMWIFITVCGFAVSLALISPEGSGQGLVRFLFAAPIFMALVLYTKDAEDLRRHVMTSVVFFAVASLSIPLQFLTGPISWFSASSERAGLERYSSLVGNLTSVGIVVGAYIVLSQAAQPSRRWLWISLMIIPAMLSLQKSAIANIVIGLVVVILLNRRAWKRLSLAVAAVAGLVVFAYALLPAVRERVSVSLLSFGVATDASAGIVRDDVTIGTSVWDRLVTYPKANFDALVDIHSPLAYLTGAGFGMGNTALVPIGDAIAPMAHNQFAEAITVFGIIGGGVQIIILLRIGFLLFRRAKVSGAPALTAVFFAYVILMVNSLFANGTLYQPSSASIFYIAFFAATTTIFSTVPIENVTSDTPRRWMSKSRAIAVQPSIPAPRGSVPGRAGAELHAHSADEVGG